MPKETDREKTKARITLRAARISSGYTAEEVADCVKISIQTLHKYELDAGKLPLKLAITLLRLYCLPLSIIHYGSESELIRSNRAAV